LKQFFLDLNELLICFYYWYASQRIWFFHERFGRHLTSFFFESFEMYFRFSCLRLLYQSHISSSLKSRQVIVCLLGSIRSILYRLFCHLVEKMICP